MSLAEQWIRDRLDGAPSELIDSMVNALSPEPVDSVADALAGAAVRLYATVACGGGGREDALDLLAADALFTHAFQARAEADPGTIVEFGARWGGEGMLGEAVPG